MLRWKLVPKLASWRKNIQGPSKLLIPQVRALLLRRGHIKILDLVGHSKFQIGFCFHHQIIFLFTQVDKAFSKDTNIIILTIWIFLCKI